MLCDLPNIRFLRFCYIKTHEDLSFGSSKVTTLDLVTPPDFKWSASFVRAAVLFPNVTSLKMRSEKVAASAVALPPGPERGVRRSTSRASTTWSGVAEELSTARISAHYAIELY